MFVEENGEEMTQRSSSPSPTGSPPDDAARPRVLNGLSGKLLVFTIIFVMMGEVLIYVPSIANFRMTWLQDRLAAAQIASLVLEATPDQMVSEELQRELLDNVGAKAVALKRGSARVLVLRDADRMEIDKHYDLRNSMKVELVWDAFEALMAGNGRIIRVVADARSKAGDTIDIVISETPLRAAMIRYSVNILTLSIILSMLTAALVFLTLLLVLRAAVAAAFTEEHDPVQPKTRKTPTESNQAEQVARTSWVSPSRKWRACSLNWLTMLHQKNRSGSARV